MKKFFNHSGAHLGFLILIASIVFSLSLFSGNISRLLQTSILGYPEHEPFDGTVYPVQEVPDWVGLDSEKWDWDYASLSDSDLIDIPYYYTSQLKVSTDDLKWGDPDDDLIRNAKITYSVPYMGNYLLDGVEYAGSHPAVDIKAPEGTPVYAIANGTVIKTSTQTSGFGNHIVIQHNNFPTLDDPNANETLYSSYSHLSGLLVSEGDVVYKGDQIGFVGATGTATTEHLHFQIDNDEAPWHPFWPFTWQEVTDAGLDFFSAINEGLGYENAIATTINPMKYVQTYLDGDNDGDNDSAEADSYVPDEIEETEETEESEVAEEVDEIEETEEVEEIVLDPPVLNFQFEVLPKYYEDQGSEFAVLVRDQYGEKFDGFTGEAVVTSVNELVRVKPAIIRNIDFDKNGRLTCEFSRMDEGRDKLKIEYEDNVYYSDWFEIIDSGESVSFSDLPESHEYYNAVSYLVFEGVVAGYPDGTFQPDKPVSRVEALKFIYEGLKESVSEGNLPFSDVSKEEWYGSYLYTAYSNGVVNGYSDGTFKPANTVNKAEFYKILFNGMGVDVNPNVEKDPFKDVKADEWFAPFAAYAKELGIIDPDVKYLNADEGMTRGEVAYAIFKLMQIMK